MDKSEFIQQLKNHHIFCSYDVDKTDKIPDNLVIEHTLIYADVDEIRLLLFLYGKEIVMKVWKERIIPDKRFYKLNYYLGKVFFRDWEYKAIYK